ncbi:hypothetical protein MHYP_G00006780 [Metynnis hypsauchen]
MKVFLSSIGMYPRMAKHPDGVMGNRWLRTGHFQWPLLFLIMETSPFLCRTYALWDCCTSSQLTAQSPSCFEMFHQPLLSE